MFCNPPPRVPKDQKNSLPETAAVAVCPPNVSVFSTYIMSKNYRVLFQQSGKKKLLSPEGNLFEDFLYTGM